MTKMLIPFFLVCFFVSTKGVSFSNQEDLSISTYYRIACIKLNSNRQFLLEYTEVDYLSAYQTFSSSNMTIDLCFRLCRRWVILIDSNRRTCVCLYTLSRLFEFNHYLGDVSSRNNCTSDHLQIYSLTNDSYILPSLLSVYDWAFDGCYYLSGNAIRQADLQLLNVSYTEVLDLCRKTCQTIRKSNYVGFSISINKHCYCLPIQLLANISPTAVRKPLVHCSFLSYVGDAFNHSIEYSQSHFDALAIFHVQRYCTLPFMFDRHLYACLKLVPFNPRKTFSEMNADENCSSIFIQTDEQWNNLLSFPFPLHRQIFISVEPNSTYSSKDDSRVVLYRTSSDRPSTVEFLPYSAANTSAFILCRQQPFETFGTDEIKVKSISNEKPISLIDNFTCPESFVLLNHICYYVHALFAYDIPQSEHICSQKHSDSHLVKYQSHEHGNVNTTRFLGRIFEDILLEFFYYQLEQKFISKPTNETTSKHWLRLLLGDTTDSDKCVLRYFIRTTGVFLTAHLCNLGGHPVCQCEPILKIQNTTDSSAIESLVSDCDTNCTNVIPDEDLLNSEYSFNNQTLVQSPHYRFRLMVIIGSLIAMAMVSIALVFLVRYMGRSRGFYSAYATFLNASRRTEPQASTVPISVDTSNTTSVLYHRLKPLPDSSQPTDLDMINLFDNIQSEDDHLQLLPDQTLSNDK